MFSQEQESAGCKLVHAKRFPPTLRQIAPADKIGVNLNCTDKEWIFLEDSDFQKKVKQRLCHLKLFQNLTHLDVENCAVKFNLYFFM